MGILPDDGRERERMRPVTAAHPCPVCGKPNWCLVAPDGTAAICQRVESGKRCGEAGWLHRLAEPVQAPPRAKPLTGPPKDWPALAARFAADCGPDRRADLAARLGLPADALDALPPVGFNPDHPGAPCFTFPETDAAGTVVGILRRFDAGTGPNGRDKLQMAGGRRGLTPPAGWWDRAGPVLVVEGPTCAAAATAAGLAAVGRPSSDGGVALLAELFRDLPADRDILVVGENDRKPGGDWPGRRGAESVARRLAAALGRPVRWALPPGDAKDCRDWLTAEARGGTPWPDRGRELLAHLTAAAQTCDPPDDDAGGRLAGATPASPDAPADPDWPGEMAPEAFHGLAGRFVAAVEPASEADPVALLVQFLVAVGNAVGRTAYATAEADRHYANEFAVLVGKSAKGRKGTSLGRVKGSLARVEPEWAGSRILGGLSSGEGLIWHVRDPIEKREPVRERGRPPRYETVVADPGEEDKRLLVVEPEFANVLKQTERQGNTLSALLRQAWETGTLQTLTKNSPAKATGAHISVIGHITADELHRYLTATESANGFGNRFLWFLVRRSKFLPDGGAPDPAALAEVERELAGVLAFARTAGEVRRSPEARELWHQVYRVLAADRHGLAGSLTGRAEAHVLRLSVLYAVLDRSAVVRPEHLAAALAVWEYADESVRCLFGDATGDPLADAILALLRSAPAGLTRTEVREMAGKNLPADRIARALGVLLSAGLAGPETRETGGRPAEVWLARRRGADRG